MPNVRVMTYLLRQFDTYIDGIIFIFWKVSNMFTRSIILLFSLLLAKNLLAVEMVTKEQIKGLDEQVQDIKKEVIAISGDLNQLEEKLLYPSNTQVSIFISLEKNTSTPPSAVKIDLDNVNVSHHIYSYKEVEALKIGGVQRIYTGNVKTGKHQLQVSFINKQGNKGKENTFSHQFEKGAKPKLVEIKVSNSGISFKNW